MAYPADFGPIYAETDLARFPVEPWNTASNLVFLLLFYYYAKKTKLNFKQHGLLVGALPLLMVGFLGGTLFHATRGSSVWLLLDFVPIAILALSATVYFWRKVLGGYFKAFLAVVLTALLPRFLIWELDIPRNYTISLSYACMGMALCLPALIFSARNSWNGIGLLLAAISLFGMAVGFRVFDQWSKPYLPMGTHFLWHLFGGLATFCIMEFLFRVNKGSAQT